MLHASLRTLLEGNNGLDVRDWFSRIAEVSLNDTTLSVMGRAHRLIEVEFYLHCHQHPDPFTHKDAMQRSCGQWYLHRKGRSFRGGSFKGLDLTFGDGRSYGGMLVRSLQTPSGELVTGPSLCVDYLLEKLATTSVAALDEKLRTNGEMLALRPEGACEKSCILSSPRIGLSLKTATRSESPLIPYVMKPYRYVVRAREITKGKLLAVLSLHASKIGVEDIHKLTNASTHRIAKYIRHFESGRSLPGFDSFLGRRLNSRDICALYGRWHKDFGP